MYTPVRPHSRTLTSCVELLNMRFKLKSRNFYSTKNLIQPNKYPIVPQGIHTETQPYCRISYYEYMYKHLNGFIQSKSMIKQQQINESVIGYHLGIPAIYKVSLTIHTEKNLTLYKFEYMMHIGFSEYKSLIRWKL